MRRGPERAGTADSRATVTGPPVSWQADTGAMDLYAGDPRTGKPSAGDPRRGDPHASDPPVRDVRAGGRRGRGGAHPGGDPPRPQPPVRSSVPPRPAGASSADAAAKFAYNPALDGLRVVCIYIILAGHMGAIHASNVAVDVFFVLSGFLITALLLAERSRTGTVSLGRFLVRRAYRLMPAMWVYLLAGLAVTVAFKWHDVPFRNDYIGSAVSAFFNVNNWYKVEHPAAGGRWLAHVWSLSLEEQFYLLWPAMFLLVTRSERLRPHLIKILLAMIVVVAIWTFTVASGGAPHSRVYLALDTHVAPLLIGCLLAVWRDARLRALAAQEPVTDPATGGRRRRHSPQSGSKVTPVTSAAVERWTVGLRIAGLGLVAGIGLVLFAFLGPNKDSHSANWLDHAAYIPSALLGAIVILSADLRRDTAWVRLLGSPRMAFLGKITFSIYLWHYPVISAANGQLVPRIGLWPSVVCAAAASTFIAYFSNRFVEKPAQRARPKWADTPRGPATVKVPDARPAPEEARWPEEVGRGEDTTWLELPGMAGRATGHRRDGGSRRDADRYTDHDFVDAPHADPGYADPRYTDPRYTDPRYADAGYGSGRPSRGQPAGGRQDPQPAGSPDAYRADAYRADAYRADAYDGWDGAGANTHGSGPRTAPGWADAGQDRRAGQGWVSQPPPGSYDRGAGPRTGDLPGFAGHVPDDGADVWVDEGYARPRAGYAAAPADRTWPPRTAPGGATGPAARTGPADYPPQADYPDQAGYRAPGDYAGPRDYADPHGYAGPGGYSDSRSHPNFGSYRGSDDYSGHGGYRGPGGDPLTGPTPPPVGPAYVDHAYLGEPNYEWEQGAGAGDRSWTRSSDSHPTGDPRTRRWPGPDRGGHAEGGGDDRGTGGAGWPPVADAGPGRGATSGRRRGGEGGGQGGYDHEI